MSLNRVQKLLLSEYCDFEDLVLIESPFAQTTQDGKGIRQVHLGLTPSKLILATDIIPSTIGCDVGYNPYIDPEIETFELIAIYPVECVNLTIYRRKKRQAIKARFCNNKVYYFELGGFERRGMFWNLWCEKIRFLNPTDTTTSRSETSVATSSTGSSLYLVDKKMTTTNGIKQLWCKFGPNFAVSTQFINEVVADNNCQSLARKWTDRYLYIGKDYQENPLDYKPITHLPLRNDFIKSKNSSTRIKPLKGQSLGTAQVSFHTNLQVSKSHSKTLQESDSRMYTNIEDYSTDAIFDNSVDFDDMAETAILIWEYFGLHSWRKSNKMKHRRRYGFAPKALFLYGLGPWHVSKGDRISLQLKRALSDVNLMTGNSDRSIKLPVSKRQLFATISCPDLTENSPNNFNYFINTQNKPPILFWTNGYWYRPISAKDAYTDLQNHLKKIRLLHETSHKYKRKKCNGRRFLRRFSQRHCEESDDDDDEQNDDPIRRKRRHSSFIFNLLGAKMEESVDWGLARHPGETSLQHLKRTLKVEMELTAWDFESTTLAQQLTLIDKDLFLKIPSNELSSILWQGTTKNAPNIAAMIGFSYRIGCLISTEILRHDVERMRARLMARFINVANKCHRISNFHSCRSVLGGLQNPAIFRLRKTWAYVRKKHSSKYQAFEFLCRLYRDPRMPSFQKTFFVFSQHPPYLPYIGHIIAKLLDKVPEYRIQSLQEPLSRQLSFYTTKSYKSLSIVRSTDFDKTQAEQRGIFSKFLSVFSRPDAGDNQVNQDKPKRHRNKLGDFVTKTVKFKGLYEYFRPLGEHDDSRREILVEVTELLERGQLGAVNYSFTINEMAREFLLKARYQEDNENFFNSVRMESSRPSTARNKHF